VIKLVLDLNNESEYSLLKLTRQQFKELKLKDYLELIEYVDIEKKSNKIFIRCKSADIVKTLMANATFLSEFKNKTILSGKEEEEYLERIFSGRNKYQTKREKKQEASSNTNASIATEPEIRKEKINAKEPEPVRAKHITFDDND
jgi:hypothetical protein